MGIFSRSAARQERIEPSFRPQAASPENPSTSLSNPDAWLLDWANGGIPLFGPPVTEATAMAVSAVYRCVSLIAGLVAGLPLKVYQDMGDGGIVETPDHRYADLLAGVPYPGRALTSFAWREMWSAQASLNGNHYSVIRRDNANRVIGFEPAPFSAVTGWRTQNGRTRYKIDWPGEPGSEYVDQADMLHFAGPGFDGVKAPSRIQAFARNAVSLARVLEEQTGRVHENAARPSGLLTVPPNISPAGLRRMRAHFDENYSGRLNAGKVIFADKDTTYTPFQMTPGDLATLQSRSYSVEEICRFWGVPPHLVGATGQVTSWGSGIEQLTLGFLRFTMDAELQRFEHELNAKLLNGTPYFARFDRDALLAMDAVASATANAAEINSGQLTPNEARRRRGRPAMPNGDELLVNSTIIPLSRAVKPPPAPPPTSPPRPSDPTKPQPPGDAGNA